jgi:hypothetical protein
MKPFSKKKSEMSESIMPILSPNSNIRFGDTIISKKMNFTNFEDLRITNRFDSIRSS